MRRCCECVLGYTAAAATAVLICVLRLLGQAREWDSLQDHYLSHCTQHLSVPRMCAGLHSCSSSSVGVCAENVGPNQERGHSV